MTTEEKIRLTCVAFEALVDTWGLQETPYHVHLTIFPNEQDYNNISAPEFTHENGKGGFTTLDLRHFGISRNFVFVKILDLERLAICFVRRFSVPV